MSTCGSWHQVKKWMILLEQRFTDHVLLLTAASTFGLKQRLAFF